MSSSPQSSSVAAAAAAAAAASSSSSNPSSSSSSNSSSSSPHSNVTSSSSSTSATSTASPSPWWWPFSFLSSSSSSAAPPTSSYSSMTMTNPSKPKGPPSMEDFITFMTNSTLNLEPRKPASSLIGGPTAGGSHVGPPNSAEGPQATAAGAAAADLSGRPNPGFPMAATATIGDLPAPESLGKNRLVICVVGRVSTGKSSLVKAFFGMSPEDEDTQELFRVDALAGTTTKAAGVVIELPPFREGETPGKVVVFDLPGLHEAKGKSRKEDQRVKAVNQNIDAYLKKNVLDVGIFVVDGVITDTIQADYKRLTEVAKKVFLVWNKIDTLDYLKPAVRNKLLEDTRIKLKADRIFPTACKGYDPNADRSAPDWIDVRGVEELKNAVYSFVYEYKQAGFLNQFRLEQFWKNLQQVSYRTLMGLKVVVVELVASSIFSLPSLPMISAPSAPTSPVLPSNRSFSTLSMTSLPHHHHHHHQEHSGGGVEDIRVDPSAMLQEEVQPKKRRTESPPRERSASGRELHSSPRKQEGKGKEREQEQEQEQEPEQDQEILEPEVLQDQKESEREQERDVPMS